MKKIFFSFATLFLVSCAGEQLNCAVADKQHQDSNTSNEFASYIEQARWGNTDAYMKLADCYCDGIGTKPDFMNMLGMLAMAEEYGSGCSVDDYVRKLPEEHEFKMLFDAINKAERQRIDEAHQIADRMISLEMQEGHTAKGVILLMQGDTLRAMDYIHDAAKRGSILSEIIITTQMDFHDVNNVDLEKMKSLCDKSPLADMFLAKLYLGHKDRNVKNDSLAAAYLLKADKNAMLTKESARWLLDYHHKGESLQLDSLDIKRLTTLCGTSDSDSKEEMLNSIENDIEVTDTIVTEQ